MGKGAVVSSGCGRNGRNEEADQFGTRGPYRSRRAAAIVWDMSRRAVTRPDTRLASRLSARLAAAAGVALLVGAFLVPATASAATDPWTVSQAEQQMVKLLNADRTSAGLVPVQVDSRLMAIARARSTDMATKHYFSHTQPDGRNVFDILTAQKITWYGAGEIIAWNNYPTLDLSTSNANSQWMNSPGHKAIILSTTLNYVGVGLAVDAASGKKYWTGVFIKGPDRTGATSTTKAPTVTAGTTTTTKRVTVGWTGADVKLQVLTSGFNYWQVQRRTDGGAWTTVWTSTTQASMTLELAGGHTYQFRTAARDKAGNWGAWSTVSTTLPRPRASVSSPIR